MDDHPTPYSRRSRSYPLEARSVGVPCIATTDGGVKETAGPHALFCEPGDIDSLVGCMKEAIQMEENQYQELCKLAKVDLEKYVRSLDQYAEEYLNLIENDEKFRSHTSNRLSQRFVLPGGTSLPCKGGSLDWLVADYQLPTGIFFLYQSYGLAVHTHPIHGICGCPLLSDKRILYPLSEYF